MKKILSILLIFSISCLFPNKKDFDLIILKELKKQNINVVDISFCKNKILYINVMSFSCDETIETVFKISNKYKDKFIELNITCFNDINNVQYEANYKKNKIGVLYKAISTRINL